MATVTTTTTTTPSSSSSSTQSPQIKLIPREGDSGVIQNQLLSLREGIPLDPLPEVPPFDNTVPHAPKRLHHLGVEEQKKAIKNALRYFPKNLHSVLAPEFAEELRAEGHIYMRRFRPVHYTMKAYPIDYYPAKCRQAAAIMLMIQNNLDPKVAQFPHELVTYGGNGSVFQNWAQYHLVMKYLSEMNENQTLVMYSGHPMGLFPSSPNGPRVVITNGMVVPNYSTKIMYDQMYALGVSMYGQMTAGSYCYIGPQGIVHGTTITLLNAGRKYLNKESLQGVVYVSSGLGGMSGAQGKAAVISNAIAVLAEVNEAALKKRHEQGWIDVVINDIPSLFLAIRKARTDNTAISIGYHGNIVHLWEKFSEEEELLVDLGSDQTSLHNPFNGGYYPVQLSFEEANEMMVSDPSSFKSLVEESLRRHVAAINKLTARGMRFWDYGNSFLLEAKRAQADICKPNGDFIYPSYVQDIMGDIFSLGFGPFRWVCTSGSEDDLRITDQIAAEAIRELSANAPAISKQQYDDNYLWITKAEGHKLVVGSQARILYSDSQGRIEIARRFNEAVKEGRMKGPIVLSRDHHDVSGVDSPFRETSNIEDGSMFCADMAVQNFVGDAFRGATWVAIHNGGGTGWGEAINGGFGLVLDGSEEAERKSRDVLFWDVNNGVNRRAWCYNSNADATIRRAMDLNPLLQVTLPSHTDDSLIESLF